MDCLILIVLVSQKEMKEKINQRVVETDMMMEVCVKSIYITITLIFIFITFII